MAGISLASLSSEFAGTFLLVFTVGCNVLSQNAVWAGVSIACVLMVSIYALGAASGANFNPAVSFALGLAGKMEGGWAQVGAYCAVQIIAGIVAGCGYSLLFNNEFNLAPSKGFGAVDASLCEFFYTFMLVFAVLNTAASKKLGDGRNQHYGLTIAFSIIAGAYGAGAVSGGCFNPAVAIGIDVSSAGVGFGWCGLYAAVELLAAAAAVAVFKGIRPEENKGPEVEPEAEATLESKLMSEFLGTYFLVLTVGLNVLADSKAAAFSIAAALTVMINSTGDISGGHYNPAVTFAIVCSGRNKIAMKEAGLYVVVQVVGAIIAAGTYAGIHNGKSFALGPVGEHDWAGVAVAEIIFTFVLTFVVLCVATVKNKPAPEFTGFIIGSCVTVGGFAIGKVSGGSLNPAVSFGIASASANTAGLANAAIYSAFELIGGGLAAGVFRVVYPGEYEKTEGNKV